jgi:hypothetical protein
VTYDVERIDGHRGSGRTREYNIKWLNYPEEFNTWEPRAMMMKDIPLMVKAYEESLKAEAAARGGGAARVGER